MMTTLLILAALFVFACGILCGLWLAGILRDAPVVDAADWQAHEGAKWADSLSRTK